MKLRLIALPFAALYWLALTAMFIIVSIFYFGIEATGLNAPDFLRATNHWLTTQIDRIHGWSWYWQ